MKITNVDSQDARISELPKTLTEDFRKRLGENLTLEPDQAKRVKRWLKERIGEWQSDTAELHRRLQDENDLVEGIIMESDYPWEGASNIHVPVTETYMDVYWSVQKRSILGAGLIWSAETDVDEMREITTEIEEAVNYLARNVWNIEKCLEGVFWTTNRDGLGVMKVTWAEDYEPARDVILITSLDEFLMEFPSPEEVGQTEEEWTELLQYCAMYATEEEPVEVPITFEKATYQGCKGEIVELIDFVTIPATAPDLTRANCRAHGMRYRARKEELRRRGDMGAFYADAVKRLIAKASGWTANSYTQSKDDIEGLARNNTKDDFELFELVVWGRLDGDEGQEGKYLLTYSADHEELLSCQEYPYRSDMYATFLIDPRPGRLIGKNVPGKTRDMNDEIDTQHNQRINARTVSSIPSFKALRGAKEELDPELEQNKWRPGVIFWLTNFDSFEQFKVQPTDLGESMAEEQNDMSILDLYLGSPVAVMSGAAAPGDPSAPGNKHAMMIQQGNLRMDSVLAALRHGVETTGDICVSHLYQFGPNSIEYQGQMGEGGEQETKTIHRKYLRKGLRMKMNGLTVVDNPDTEMRRSFELFALLMQEPYFASNDQSRVDFLRDALRKGRVQGRERYLPTVEQVQQQMIEVQKQALAQLAAEAAAEDQQAAADQQNANVQNANTELKLRKTAESMAASGLGLPGGANGKQPVAA